jgi:hypothetical protein
MNPSFTATICLGIALHALPASVSGQTSLNKRVTIDVTAVPPRDVVALLARAVGCTIDGGSDPGPPASKPVGSRPTCRFHVDPAVTQPLTIRLVDVPVDAALGMICQSIPCEYRFDGTNVWLKPLSESRKRQTSAMQEYFRKLESRLPQGMRFDGATLASVLEAIGQATGLELKPYKGEGDRKVTLEVGGKTVNEALEAVVRQVNGEGVVMIRSWDGSMAQYRVVPQTQKNPGRDPE